MQEKRNFHMWLVRAQQSGQQHQVIVLQSNRQTHQTCVLIDVERQRQRRTYVHPNGVAFFIDVQHNLCMQASI